MREHLYRGKCIDSGEWVEGSYVKAHKWFGDGKAGHFIYDIYGENRALVDPETVSEFTGLHDKNGKHIFEGDVVKEVDEDGIHNKVAAIEFGEYEVQADCYEWTDAYGFYLKGNTYSTNIPDYENSVIKLEIIGNKWDNPELLEAIDEW